MSMLFASLVFGLFCAGYVRGYALNNYALHFPNKGVSDYANIWGMRNLTEFTVCFWMKSSDTNNKGTVFSYAVPGEDNELLLFNYKDFCLYISGKRRKLGQSANDGKWHHICVTWKNSDGASQFYKDGVLRRSISFMKGYTIKAGGSLVLGQDQDRVGSGFQASQCFRGTLVNVNVWSSVLSSNRIRTYSESCFAGEGDVYKWTDFLYGVKGSTAFVLPSSCSSQQIE